jgi:hypothetical protein
MKQGTTVKIKKEYLSCKEEGNLVFVTISEPNANNKIDIVSLEKTMTFEPIESVFVYMLEVIN